MPQLVMRPGIQDYLRIFFYRVWWIGGVFAVCLGTSGGCVITAERVYRSENQIAVTDKNATDPLLANYSAARSVATVLGTLEQRIKSEKKGREIMRDVPALGAGAVDPVRTDADGYPLVRNQGILDSRLALFRASLSILPRGYFIRVGYDAPDGRLAKAVVDRVTEMLISEYVLLQDEQVEYATAFIDKELDVYEKRTRETESELKEYGKLNPIEFSRGTKEILDDLSDAQPQTAHSALAQLTNLFTRLNEMESLIKEKEETAEVYRKQLRGERQMVPESLTRDYSPEAKRLLDMIAAKSVEISDLRVSRTESHPYVQKAARDLEKLKVQFAAVENKYRDITVEAANPLRRHIEEQLRRLEAEVQGLKASHAQTKAQAAVYEEKIKSLPEKELGLIRRRMDHNINLRMLSMLRDRKEIAEITVRTELAQRDKRFEVVEKAKVPTHPIKPKVGLIFLMGFMVAGLSSAAVVFFLEYADHSVRGIEDLKRYFDLPVLGAISDVEGITEEDERRARHPDRGFWSGLTVRVFRRGREMRTWVLAGFVMAGIVMAIAWMKTNETAPPAEPEGQRMVSRPAPAPNREGTHAGSSRSAVSTGPGAMLAPLESARNAHE
ncbi:MAG: hypothetical protein V1809_07745 [Planctomycetota bacterium]